MKKLVLLAFLVGCGASTPQATTTPDPDPVVAPSQEANAYIGVLEALYSLIEMDTQEFASFCSEIGWAFNADTAVGGFSTCLGADGEGLALRTNLGTTIGSAVLVPGGEGQKLADAVFAEVGNPDQIVDGAAVWDLSEFILIFTAAPSGQWLLILERTGTSL